MPLLSFLLETALLKSCPVLQEPCAKVTANYVSVCVVFSLSAALCVLKSSLRMSSGIHIGSSNQTATFPFFSSFDPALHCHVCVCFDIFNSENCHSQHIWQIQWPTFLYRLQLACFYFILMNWLDCKDGHKYRLKHFKKIFAIIYKWLLMHLPYV